MSDAERLRDGPATGIDLGALPLELRAMARKIAVNGTPGHSTENSSAQFTNVVYLDGDQQAAAELFAEVNADKLEQMEFSKRNVLQTSMERPLYDLILDAHGERKLEWCEDLIVERRRDGSTWVFEKEAYISQQGQRYRVNDRSHGAARVDRSLQALYDELKPTITPSTLREAGVEGDVAPVIAYYRQNSEFDNTTLAE
ncbi:hypothetical protein [Halobaculum rubrum]|uniref:hypothetical protein n=1 Tax=Halobaculum rubrum TaxID=2872158 RepID=UPI001CA43A9A|nr:hypothetical protein [Halobaculum rubrum]QZX98716.1 hypothetical protein K6T25_10570 [Halobaculum rubrum]